MTEVGPDCRGAVGGSTTGRCGGATAIGPTGDAAGGCETQYGAAEGAGKQAEGQGSG
jgi:hypothetical protein